MNMPPKTKSKFSTPILPPITRLGSTHSSPITEHRASSPVNRNGLSEEGSVIFNLLMEKLDSIVDELTTKS